MDVVKKCAKCKKRKELKYFYSNNQWKDEFYRDRWCKVCISKFVTDENTLKEYFSENRRLYPFDYWGQMYSKAKAKIKKDIPRLEGKEKEERILTITIGKCLSLMNFKGYYKFIETEYIKNDEDTGDIRKDEKTKVYNKKWHGFYTDEDIKYLEEYYEGLDNDFRLSNHSYKDYAKKVCKASLAMDKAFSDMQSGFDNADKRYDKLRNIFDTLSQSAKFAEKSRSTNDVVGFGSLGELINSLEENGFLTKPVRFSDDDIDLIVDDFRWIISSVGEKF